MISGGLIDEIIGTIHRVANIICNIQYNLQWPMGIGKLCFVYKTSFWLLRVKSFSVFLCSRLEWEMHHILSLKFLLLHQKLVFPSNNIHTITQIVSKEHFKWWYTFECDQICDILCNQNFCKRSSQMKKKNF